MTTEIRLNQLRSVLEEMEFPIRSRDARQELEDVTLLYADGEEPLAAVVSRTDVDTFEDADDLEVAIQNNLPIEAVGEPGQSEGDA